MCMYLCRVRVCAQVHTGAKGGQNRLLSPLKLGYRLL